MNLVIPLSGEEAAQCLAGVIEYNGFHPQQKGVHFFANIGGTVQEVVLERVEVVCEGVTLKVRTQPEGDTPMEQAMKQLEQQRASMDAQVNGLAVGAEP